MPPFPERESSILAKLKRKKGPGAGSALDDGRRDPSSSDINGGVEPTPSTVVSPLGLGHQAEATRASLLLTCSSSPSLPAVDALALCRPPGAAGSPSPSSSLGPLGHRQPPGGRLLRRPSPPAQPGAHPRGGLPQVPTPGTLGRPFPSVPPNSLLCPCPCASVHPGCLLPPSGHSGLSAAPGHPLLSLPITVSQPALPSLLPSALFLSGPLAACLGLAACHACLLCLLWDWMAQ